MTLEGSWTSSFYKLIFANFAQFLVNVTLYSNL